MNMPRIEGSNDIIFSSIVIDDQEYTLRPYVCNVKNYVELTYQIVDDKPDLDSCKIAKHGIRGLVETPILWENKYQGKFPGDFAKHLWDSYRDDQSKLVTIGFKYDNTNDFYKYTNVEISGISFSVKAGNVLNVKFAIQSMPDVSLPIKEQISDFGTPRRIITWNDVFVDIYEETAVILSGDCISEFEISHDENDKKVKGKIKVLNTDRMISDTLLEDKDFSIKFGYYFLSIEKQLVITVMKARFKVFEKIEINHDLTYTVFEFSGINEEIT